MLVCKPRSIGCNFVSLEPWNLWNGKISGDLSDSKKIVVFVNLIIYTEFVTLKLLGLWWWEMNRCIQYYCGKWVVDRTNGGKWANDRPMTVETNIG